MAATHFVKLSGAFYDFQCSRVKLTLSSNHVRKTSKYVGTAIDSTGVESVCLGQHWADSA